MKTAKDAEDAGDFSLEFLASLRDYAGEGARATS